MVKITVKGLNKATAYLTIKKLAIKGKLASSMRNVGVLMEGEVKSSIAGRRAEPTSVDTGNFLRSVTFSSGKDSATISSNVSYADFLEYGTTRMKARRHFNNSKARNKGKIRNIIGAEISKI